MFIRTTGTNASLRFESVGFDLNLSMQHDLEWKMTYVGSADSETHDQVLGMLREQANGGPGLILPLMMLV